LTEWKGVTVYLGGCFAVGHKDADFVTVDTAGTLHVWQGDEYIQEYLAGDWEDYKID
jgi:hypothetical protein